MKCRICGGTFESYTVADKICAGCVPTWKASINHSNNSQGDVMPEDQETTKTLVFPVTNYTIATDGILCETFYSPTISTRLIIPEAQVNQMFQAWLETRKKLQAQQQLIADVMRKKLN
jgi:hypothetical protein